MEDDKGNSVSFVGKQIGFGGEGDIYRTNQSGIVAKIYKNLPTQDQINKLNVMIANPPKNPSTYGSYGNHISIAWPNSLLTKDGKCIGFLMPEIAKNVGIINVYNPKRRKQVLPKFDWIFLHITALNFVEIVGSLHRQKYIIGDIKPQNILVNNQAAVSIVDADSFQVKNGSTVYRCRVASEGFTPPELIGSRTSNITQTIYHDRYRVALIIYHLLFARHPFEEGSWCNGEEKELEELMKGGIWLYNNAQNDRQPNKNTIPFQTIHPKLQQLFKQCFNDGHNNPIERPSTQDWSDALKLAIEDLAYCSKVDTHNYSEIYGRCYWCERANIMKDIFAGESPKNQKPKIKITSTPISRRLPSPSTTTKPRSTRLPSTQPSRSRRKKTIPVKNSNQVNKIIDNILSGLADNRIRIIASLLLGIGIASIIVGYGNWIVLLLSIVAVIAGIALFFS